MAFPTNPSVGDTFTTGSKSYRWDGNVWSRSTDSLLTTANITESGNNFFYSNTRVKNYLGNFDGPLVPASDEGYNLGSSAKKWANLFLSGNTLVLGQTKIESSGDGSIAIKSTNTQVTTAISFASNGYIAAPSGALATASGSVSASPRIANVRVTDNSYNYLDDTAANSQGYVEINGASFDNGATVIIGTTSASSVTFVNSTRLRVGLPTLSAGTYPVYVVNSDGSTATRINGLNISGFPSWNTASGSLGNFPEGLAPNILLNATSDTSVTYALVSGSSLPANLSLNSNGLISGNLTNQASNTTYNFSISAIDVELQNTNRSFSLTAIYDPPIWFSPISNTSYIYSGISNSLVTIPLHANLINQNNISYSANAFSGNLTLSGNTISGYLPYASSNSTVFSTLISASSPAGRTSNITIIFVSNPTPTSGQIEYTTAGTYTWVAPFGITSVSVVAVGGGGGGAPGPNGGGGGGGGALAYTNNIPVSGGSSYTVVVGAGGWNFGATSLNPGGLSSFNSTSVRAGGGCGGKEGGTGGTVLNGTGGAGGAGAAGLVSCRGGGGGGAGGYSGNGGNGTAQCSGSNGVAGAGGGGGGGAGQDRLGSPIAGAGGGVGLCGQGPNGAGGTYGVYTGSSIDDNNAAGGRGGSGGSNPVVSAPWIYAGTYGGGAGGNDYGSYFAHYCGGVGAVRIVWAAPGCPARCFPSTNVTNL